MKAVLVELDGLPTVYALLESADNDVKREAMGILFGLGYRKGMTLEELLNKNRLAAPWDSQVLAVAKIGFDATFGEANYEVGKKLSMAEIDRKGTGVGVFAYGEAELDSFAWVLGHAAPQPGEAFVDLGSGLGCAMVAAFLLQDFSKIVGYELLEDLAAEADVLIEKFHAVHKELPVDSAAAARDPGVMESLQGDFLVEDWSDADVVYANATRFDQPLIEAISKKAEELKPGARFVITTNPLISDHFSLKKRGRSMVSWMGSTPQTFFVFVRNND